MIRTKEEGGRRKNRGSRLAVPRRRGFFAPLFFLPRPSCPGQTPLPDADDLLHAARENLARAGRVQDQFAYKERRTEMHTNPFGRLGTGGDDRLRGDAQSRTARASLDASSSATASRSANGEVEQLRPAPPPRSRPVAVGDPGHAVGARLRDRSAASIANGRPTILVTFTPKPDAKPATREGPAGGAFTGKIWVDEATEEVMRVEATAIDSISYGYGLLARLNEGTVVTLRARARRGRHLAADVDPVQGRRARAAVAEAERRFRIEWFDYRRAGDVRATNREPARATCVITCRGRVTRASPRAAT